MRHNSPHCPSVTWGGLAGKVGKVGGIFANTQQKAKILCWSIIKVDFQKLLCKFVYLFFVVFDFWMNQLKMTGGYEELHSQPKLRSSCGSLQLTGIQVLMAKWTMSRSTKVLCPLDLWCKKRYEHARCGTGW